MNEPVAITGIGVVSPAGVSAAAFWDGLLAQHDLRGGWSRGDLSLYPHDNVVEIPEQVWHAVERDGGGKRIDALAGFSIEQALSDAGLAADAGRIGCYFSSTTAGVEGLEQGLLAPTSSRHPEALDGSHILASAKQHWSGPTSLLSTACSSGLLAPALAIDAIAGGEADVMLAGGVDVLLEYTACGFSGLRLTTDDQCRPFNAQRKGVVLSEGSVCFCLESLSAALRRGAHIHGVILGYGIGCDADHVTAPNTGGIARAMTQALETSGMQPAAIGGVFAHGTGSQANDLAEVNALRAVFGAAIPPVTAIKSTMGHPQAAAGSFSLLAATLALKTGQLPPTAGLSEADPALGEVDVVMQQGRPLAANCLMVNAFGFGGNNCVMVVADLATALRHSPELADAA
ncbi:beta-ketoacyl-[acyl-carrier-protein] synthase family protein [Paraherbaspirillum soli]|uniref:Beta-ketoacyl-[acyl-carrier-protein] synthase family protein n=1 Tax=Paraherbaspirillum soli TaxID=631222 RepID=A0ABW0M5N8_9BURK